MKKVPVLRTRVNFIHYILSRGELTDRRIKTLDAFLQDLQGVKKSILTDNEADWKESCEPYTRR